MFWTHFTFVLLIAAIGMLVATFLRGKGGFLIAGYNMMPKEEKQNIDEPALCRFMGWVCIPLAVAAIGCYVSLLTETEWLNTASVVLIFATVTFALIWTNARFKRFQKAKA